MPLPTLCDPVTVRAMLAQEQRILAAVEAVPACHDDVDQLIREHAYAVHLANELAIVHEGDNPADQSLHAAATQLKAYHLLTLQDLLTTY